MFHGDDVTTLVVWVRQIKCTLLFVWLSGSQSCFILFLLMNKYAVRLKRIPFVSFILHHATDEESPLHRRFTKMLTFRRKKTFLYWTLSLPCTVRQECWWRRCCETKRKQQNPLMTWRSNWPTWPMYSFKSMSLLNRLPLAQIKWQINHKPLTNVSFFPPMLQNTKWKMLCFCARFTSNLCMILCLVWRPAALGGGRGTASGIGPSGLGSSCRGTPCLMAKLCITQQAMMILHTFSGRYCSVRKAQPSPFQ